MLPAAPTRRHLLAALLAGAAAPALAGAPTRSPRPRPRPGSPAAPPVAPAAPATPATQTVPEAEALIAAARLGGAVAFALVDARTGALLEAREADRPLPPASVAKAVTALYALDTLGRERRFPTRLVATGPVSGGRLAGDLALVGGGDPALDTDALGDMAAALRSSGLREVAGRFLVHGGALPFIPRIDPAQPEHVGYNPAISGLNLNYNRVHLEWRRAGQGWRLAVDARGTRFRPPVTLAEVRVVSRESPTFTLAEEGGRERWTVAARALRQDGSRWLPTRRPELYAGEVFRTLARGQGIALPAPEVAAGRVQGSVLVERQSDDLATLVRDMLRWSTNLTAEALGLAASAARGGPVATLAASAARMGGWAQARLGLARPGFVDHSGLGDGARLAAGDMAHALVRAGADGALRGLMRPFQMRDAAGNPQPGHPLRVAAKTGTLNFVSGLAGWIATPGGRDLAFAIFAADVPRRDALPVEQRERPPGGAEWTARARRLQQQLIERWGALYG